MIAKQIAVRVLGVAALLAGFGLNAVQALPPAPKPEEMAAVQPKQAGVEVSVLAPADIAKSRVEPFPNAQAPVGYVLLDSTNRPVRRFVAVNTPNFNILSFYLDGEEVYRETDSKGTGKVDQFRWLGSNGGKIGRDLTGNGGIDVWDAISPEEVSKELFDAIATKNPNKLKALMATEAELKSLGLPQAEIAAMQARINGAAAKLTATATALGLNNKSKWIHVEFFVPETKAFDSFAGSQDLIRHRNGGVLFEKGDGKNAEFFQTGELVKIGNAWRVIDGPAPGMAQAPQRGNNAPLEIPAAAKALVEQLLQIIDPGPGPAQLKYHTDRAATLEKIIPILDRDPSQETWMRQLIDAHASASELGDKASTDRLGAWVEQINKYAPKSPMAGFASFRKLSADFTIKLKDATTQVKMDTVQKWWREELDKFVKDYPAIDETPEALFRLAMANEGNGKTGEQNAVANYTRLAKDFPQHPLAAQSTGAANRLSSEGKPFAFVGCANVANGQLFGQAGIAGKVTVVYFWGSFAAQNGKLKEDAAYFAELAKKYKDKLEVVTVCIDAAPQAAVPALNAAQFPGTHLTSPTGQMATAWGIMGQHIFLLDKNGKVEDKNASIPMIGDEIEKLAK